MREKLRILITGSSGMLGKDIVKAVSDDEDIETFGISRHALKLDKLNYNHFICELTDFSKLKNILVEINPHIIINCAACTDIAKCEQNKKYTYNLHVNASKILAKYKPGSTRIIYISTDSVFDGVKGAYSEEDSTSPLNYYAETKWLGEKETISFNNKSLILRVNIYGYNIPIKNSLAEWAIKSWKAHKVINGYENIYFNPLYTKQLSEIIYMIIKQKSIYGVLHLGCKQNISKYEFLKILAESLKVKSVFINPFSFNDDNLEIKRPKNTTLALSKFESLFNNTPDIYEGINELANDFKKEGLF